MGEYLLWGDNNAPQRKTPGLESARRGQMAYLRKNRRHGSSCGNGNSGAQKFVLQKYGYPAECELSVGRLGAPNRMSNQSAEGLFSFCYAK
jgi:hypothetical protein